MKNYIIFVAIILIMNCSPSRYLQGNLFKDKEKVTVAVLPFSGSGDHITERIKFLAADELTTFLYVKKEIPVIDRSRVNYVLAKMNIDNTYLLSGEELVQISDTLCASIIVLGSIVNDSRDVEIESEKKRIIITLRFLNGQTGEVIGMLYKRRTSKKDIAEVVRSVLKKIVGEI